MSIRILSGTLKPNSHHGGTAKIIFEDHSVGGHTKVVRQAKQGDEGPYRSVPSVVLGIEELVIDSSVNDPCVKPNLSIGNVSRDELNITYSGVALFSYMVVGEV